MSRGAHAPWLARLAFLPLPTARWLAGWSRTLATCLGPLAITADPGGSDIDGYDGLSRRGPWSRVLPSEWALLGVAPLEVARRISMAEQLRYALGRTAPRADAVAHVLFDAGPDQLGVPRVAHLTMLTVLTERAAAAGVRLRWGVLQDERRVWRDSDGRDAARALLGARSWRSPSEDDRSAWARVVPDGAVEVLVVGGSGARLPGARAVTVTQALDGTLAVSVDTAPAPVRLHPPPERLAEALLQGRFVPEGDPGEEAPRLWVDGGTGGRVLVGTPQDVTAVALPRPGEVRARGRVIARISAPDQARVVAAAWWRDTLVAVTCEPAGLRLLQAGRARGGAMVAGDAPSLPLDLGGPVFDGEGPPRPMVVLPQRRPDGRSRHAVVVLDDRHTLWTLEWDRARAIRVEAGATSLVGCHGGWACVVAGRLERDGGGQRALVGWQAHTSLEEGAAASPVPGVRRRVWRDGLGEGPAGGFVVPLTAGALGFALPDGGDDWVVGTARPDGGGGFRRVSLPYGATLLGLVSARDGEVDPVVLDETARGLARVRSFAVRERIGDSERPVVAATCAAQRGQLVTWSTCGTLQVWDAVRGDLLVSLRVEGV